MQKPRLDNREVVEFWARNSVPEPKLVKFRYRKLVDFKLSKYRTSFLFILTKRNAKVYRSCNHSRTPQKWEEVSVTIRHRKRLYVLDAAFLPYKLRWIDATSAPFRFAIDRACYILRRVVKSLFFEPCGPLSPIFFPKQQGDRLNPDR